MQSRSSQHEAKVPSFTDSTGPESGSKRTHIQTHKQACWYIHRENKRAMVAEEDERGGGEETESREIKQRQGQEDEV